MTFVVKRNERDPEQVDIQYTDGPTTIKMTEHRGHLLGFARDLKAVLDGESDNGDR